MKKFFKYFINILIFIDMEVKNELFQFLVGPGSRQSEKGWESGILYLGPFRRFAY